MITKAIMTRILDHAIDKKPFCVHGDASGMLGHYTHGFTAYYKASGDCILELALTHGLNGTWLNAILYQKIIDIDGKPYIIEHKRHYGKPNKTARDILRHFVDDGATYG